MDLQVKLFSELSLEDEFFNSLRESYAGFDDWFRRKAIEGARALTYFEDGKLKDFLYLKNEKEALSDVCPNLPPKRRLKVGTFKIDNRGTKRGERFLKKVFDKAIADDAEEIYVTIFPEKRLQPLIRLFETYGFHKVAIKKHKNGNDEDVLVRDMKNHSANMLSDYPYVHCGIGEKYVLSIYPKYHTQMFPDSILATENQFDAINDLSETNSIYKVYICWMRDVWHLKSGDKVVIYRTTDIPGKAYFRSVATSVSSILETKTYRDFDSEDDFINYMKKYSVFNETELRYWYNKKSNFTVIKMLYNFAFKKRVIMRDLIEKVGISKDIYWGFFRLRDEQFNKILKLGEVNERYIID